MHTAHLMHADIARTFCDVAVRVATKGRGWDIGTRVLLVSPTDRQTVN